MEERRFGQTHPDVLALNPQLEAGLEVWQEVYPFRAGITRCPYIRLLFIRIMHDDDILGL